MKKKIALVLSAAILLGAVVFAADEDGWTEAPLTEAAENGAWEQWCELWETEKEDWENISITPGKDETELNFGWYSKEESGIPSFVWYKAENDDEVVTPGALDEAAFENALCSVIQSEAVPGYNSNKVVVDGINLGEKYFYSYTKDGQWTEPCLYNAASQTDSFSFVLVGDPQIGSSYENTPTGESDEQGQDRGVRNDSFNWNNTIEKAYELNPEISFFLSAGDQIQSRDKKTSESTHSVYTDNEIEYAGYLMPELLKQIPVATTIGNHDALSSNYTYHFNNPNSSDTGCTYAGGDYYFQYGNALFIMLNTNNTNVAEHGAFIEEACNSFKSAKWIIVSLHQDIYGSGEHSNEPEIVELRYGLIPYFEENNVDVVLTGHDHTYSRSYMMKGAEKDEDAFIDEDTFEAYFDGDIEEDEVYGNYLTSIGDSKYIAETDSDVVTNPEGILYLTANSSSGSKYYDLVEHQQAYIAARWQEDIPTFSMIDISDNEFTVNTYRTDTMTKIDTEFTILKEEVKEEISTEETSEETTEASTEASTEETTKASAASSTSKKSSSGSGKSSSKAQSSSDAAKAENENQEAQNDVNADVQLTTNKVKVPIGSNIIEVNGSEVAIDAAAYIQPSSNSAMVPLRFAAIAILGGNADEADTSDIISWNGEEKKAIISIQGITAEFTAGSNIMKVNGVSTEIENNAAAEIKDGRMFIPFRALGNLLKINVVWDTDSKTAIYG